ncbi:hypothetical protein SAMN05216420_10455 [Nitrosospira sp. Nl5]|uniref:hypothetical protein n=1 Tax=Nitrosospira sp. Nl5 TaxID=200120 RepID=UPI00088CF88F|nr:hypothetical protein [Nitrosospira sp. Nl5]SCY26916.1 hypothetical protein SAMN05216420_10455 [Nitrosospira sp. Nl5]
MRVGSNARKSPLVPLPALPAISLDVEGVESGAQGGSKGNGASWLREKIGIGAATLEFLPDDISFAALSQ